MKRARQISVRSSLKRAGVLPIGLLHACQDTGIIVGKHADILIFTALSDFRRYNDVDAELSGNGGGRRLDAR